MCRVREESLSDARVSGKANADKQTGLFPFLRRHRSAITRRLTGVALPGVKENSRTGPGECGKDCKRIKPLPSVADGWQPLHVRCLVDYTKLTPQYSTDALQMLREDWAEKDEHYTVDLTVKKRESR